MFGAIVGGIGKALGAVGSAIGLDGIVGGLGTAAGSAASAAASYEADRRLMQKSQEFNAREAAISRDFNRIEAAKGRAFASGQAELARQFGTGERVAQQAFSAEQAQKQMNFQRQMASTQVSRQAADMERAGLNRILALGQPAAAPHGAMAAASQAASPVASASSASGPAASHGGSPGSGAAAVRNAISLASAMEEIKLIRAQTNRTNAEARATEASADRSEGVNIPFTMLMDQLGRGGEAAKTVRALLDKVQDATGGSIIERGKSSWNYLKDKADAVRTIYINRGRDSATHPNRK